MTDLSIIKGYGVRVGKPRGPHPVPVHWNMSMVLYIDYYYPVVVCVNSLYYICIC